MRIMVQRLGAGFLFFLFTAMIASAQTIEGVVTDNQSLPLAGATVMILKPSDSVMVSGITADSVGFFRFKGIIKGSYLLKISYIGYRDFYKAISVAENLLLLQEIHLQNGSSKLNEVLIEGKTPPVQQKGDTAQYNANAFKTNPDASAEELVTKMPGITQQDGKIQAQGEDVKSVTVDGKPFFGDDPNSVLKNIPAEMIDNIQVFDRKSDQSLFTGFDDGNSSKTINIVTRPQFRNGVFGKAFVGYGDNNRYKSGATVNFFKGKRRFTILAQSNNINEQNFSMEDLAGVVSPQGGGNRPGGGMGMGGGGYRGQGGMGGGGQRQQYQGPGSDVGNFLVNQSSGINTTHALGLNYANQWKKWDITGSYFFNFTGNEANSDLFRQYSASATEGLTYSEQKKSTGNNINHRINLKVDYKIDSLRSIIVQPKVSGQFNNGNPLLTAHTDLPAKTLSTNSSVSSSRLTALNFSLPLLFRNGFKKKGRTFSLNITPGYNTYEGEAYLQSVADGLIDTLQTDSIDQFSTLDKTGYVLTANTTYTEPLGEKWLLSFSYLANYNANKSDKETFDKPFFSDEYLVPNPVLTNHYQYTYFAHSLGTGLRYQKGILNLSLGAAVQNASSTNIQNGILDTDYATFDYSFLPNAMVMIRFDEKKNLRLYYRTSNNPPGTDQLQQVVNNSNPLQVSTGNPYLKQDWSHFMNIRYSGVNTAKNTSFFVFLNVNYTRDYIGNSTYTSAQSSVLVNGYLLQQGAQVTQPVNLDESYSIRSFINYSFTVKQIKSNINLNAGAGYSKAPSLTNGKRNNAFLTTPMLGVAVTSNINKQVDFTLSSNTALTFNDNSLQAQLNSKYIGQTTRFKMNLMPWKGLVLQSDVTYQIYSGLTDTYNENYWLWNAGIGYKFLKKQAAEIRFSVNDILEQNKSISRTTTELYYEDIRTLVLKRYFMLTFTYNLKFYKEPNPAK